MVWHWSRHILRRQTLRPDWTQVAVANVSTHDHISRYLPALKHRVDLVLSRGETCLFQIVEKLLRRPHCSSHRSTGHGQFSNDAFARYASALAAASTASASTVRPAVAHSGVILSASLWLIPPWQGQNSMTAGTLRAM